MHSSVVHRRSALLATAVALVLPFVVPNVAFAQADNGAGAGVARISLIAGSVAVQRGDAATPSAAVINAPVLAGDYLTTGDDSRAEVQMDGGTIVRLGGNVQMRLTRLDGDARAIQVAEGTVELRLMRGTEGRADIDTPSVTVRPRLSGSYRVSVTGDGRTLVTVRSGDAVIVTPQGDRSLTAGSTLVAQGPASNPSITTQTAVALDEFDRFNQDRDARYERALADEKYVSRDIVGADDLNTYGRWAPDSTYGQVWVPANVASDWAPYRNGRWVWEEGFGWTWVGYEPWGWAPYHYGAWYRSPAYGWCWYPPQYGAYTPWRPGLVAFFSFGGGSIGWVPLAPYEPWHPWWGRHWHGSPTIVNNTTIVNNYYDNDDVIRRTYRNAQYGVTTVPGKRFLLGRFERPAVMKPSELRNVQIVRGALPIVPTAQNLRYSDRPVAPHLALHPPIVQGAFAGEAAPVRRMPFEQQRTAIDAATNGTATPQTTHVRHTLQAADPRPAGDPWSRFGANRGVGAMRSTGGGTVTTQTQLQTQAQTPHVDRSAGANASAGAWSRFDGADTGARRRIESTQRNAGGPAAPPVTTTTTRAYDTQPRAYDSPSRAYRNADAPSHVAPQQPHSSGEAPRQTTSRPPQHEAGDRGVRQH
jgi:FecR protein